MSDATGELAAATAEVTCWQSTVEMPVELRELLWEHAICHIYEPTRRRAFGAISDGIMNQALYSLCNLSDIVLLDTRPSERAARLTCGAGGFGQQKIFLLSCVARPTCVVRAASYN